MPDTFALESEVARLRAENSTLSEELAQVTSDKEFVWSLWKRLQVASPDLTQAVGLVVAREKEKAEVKDKKVLQILQLKDQKAAELEKQNVLRMKELQELHNRKEEAEQGKRKTLREVEDLEAKIKNLKHQLDIRDDKDREAEQLHKQVVSSFERDRNDLTNQLADLRKENGILRSENSEFNALNVVNENKIKNFQSDLREINSRYEGAIEELEDSKRKLSRYQVDMKKYSRDLESKAAELDKLNAEFEELWHSHKQCKEHALEQAALINQLQHLQQDTQKLLKKQGESSNIELTSMQSAFNELETRYNDLRNVEIQLQQQIAQYKDELVSRDVEMVNFERQIKRKQAQSSQADLDAMNRSTQITEPIREQDYKINSLQNEIGVLKEKLKDKNRLIRSLKGDTSMNISVEHISPVKSPKSDKKDDKRDLLAKIL